MERLSRSSLWGLEQYAVERDRFRKAVIAHKNLRRIALGPHFTLVFEDFLTMKYQVQEMLRTERIFEPAQIAEEIEAYDPLIPDGSNWKATFMIEYDDVTERRQALTRLRDVEHRVWAQVAGHDRVFAIANEDLERSNDEKTAAVHFLRFELSAPMVQALKHADAALSLGIDHSAAQCDSGPVAAATRKSLVADLD